MRLVGKAGKRGEVGQRWTIRATQLTARPIHSQAPDALSDRATHVTMEDAHEIAAMYAGSLGERRNRWGGTKLLVTSGPNADRTSMSRFMAIWRRQSDGQFKIFIDFYHF
jgi:hypothetical protein